MERIKQYGYLVLVDISGYTSYVAATEIEHSQEVLAELLELIVDSFKSLLTLSKLEGDAVFAYIPKAKLPRGETLLELVESTYVVFRDRVEATLRRTTCECNACRAIPNLDLKFIVHSGDFIVQDVSGIHELLGSDVNLVHRLAKNHVTETTGWHAYTLYTARVLADLGISSEGMQPLLESYEHLGEIQTFSFNLRQRYQELVDQRVAFVTPEEALATATHDYPLPPPAIWEWLNDPYKRTLCLDNPHAVLKPVFRPGGRTGAGTRNHCVHGKKVAMQETILDWRPFDYFTSEQSFYGFVQRITYRLTPIHDGEGTRVDVALTGRSPVPGILNRPVFMLMANKVNTQAQFLELMGKLIEEANNRQPENETISTPVPDPERVSSRE